MDVPATNTSGGQLIKGAQTYHNHLYSVNSLNFNAAIPISGTAHLKSRKRAVSRLFMAAAVNYSKI